MAWPAVGQERGVPEKLDDLMAYTGMMERDTQLADGINQQSLIPSDLEPIYMLTEQDYQTVVNNLTNTVIGTISRLQMAGHEDAAWLLGEEAHDVLLDYDEDVADYVWRLSRGIEPEKDQPDQDDTTIVW